MRSTTTTDLTTRPTRTAGPTRRPGTLVARLTLQLP